LQDRFIVVVWGIEIHHPESYRAKVEKTRSNYFKKSDAPIDACDVLRMESLIVHESIVISDQFGASRCDNAKVFPRHCEEPPGRAKARPMTGSATRQSTLPDDLPSREPTACRWFRRLKFRAVRPADRCIVEFDLPLVILKGTKKRRNTRMKFVSYGEFGQERAGFLRASQIVDLEKAMIARALQNPVSDMRLFLERVRWKDELAALEKVHGDDQVFEIASVRLGAPVPVPRKLLIAGANTFSHLKEAAPLLGDISPPIDPMILGKATSSIAGPFDDMVLPPETTKLDYEVEVGIVIGKKCRRISKQQVKDHVAGFVTVNEASARDIQLASKEKNPFYRVHFVGKSFDTFCPMGPALVTVDEFEWGKPLKMRTLVNGKIRQDSDTSDLCHGFERLVSFISEAMTLFPGDVIASGSPAGVGNFMEPTGFLKVGDVVRCEVDGIGAIENRVVG
jgi:2-keto-4-pentenoate hydratase/2-oxohepta-3-ene-1,7-dioic acid hydratase in catechol pathway